MGLKKRFFLFLLFIIYAFSPLFAQKLMSIAQPLSDEISRLEKVSRTAAPSTSYEAFLALAHLNMLSGYYEAALESFEGARELVPGDSRALFEQARLLISLGEYERAAVLTFELIDKAVDKETTLKARFLSALLEAYRFKNLNVLTSLADDSDFSDVKSTLYYTLWKLSGLPSWETRLKTEFPNGAEAKIAGGLASLSPTPHWLLFPGRDGISSASPSAPPTVASPSVPPPVASPSETPPVSGVLLQTGLFSHEANAMTFSERLKKYGFDSSIIKRQVNGADFWAVAVQAGKDMNATIKKLKDCGFESFPVKL